MQLTRHSKIKEAWHHPVGHDVLQNLLIQLDRDENWPANPLVANLPLPYLDRIGGPGFADMLVEMAEREKAPAPSAHLVQPAWWKEAVIYQIYMPSFMDSNHDGVGDIGGVIQRLPYLARLGVDVLWLWPLLDTPGNGLHGARDFKDINADLGTLEEFESLVQLAHERGMRVVIGQDIEATSDEHPWFVSALEGGPTKDYYIFRPGEPETPPNNWGRPGMGPAWTYYPQMKAWALHLVERHRMDLNWDNPDMRDALADALRYWLDKGVDGFFFGPVNTLSKMDFENGSAAAQHLSPLRGYEKFIGGKRVHRYLRELRQAITPPPPPDGEEAPSIPLLAGEVKGAGTETAKLFTGDDTGELDMIFDASHLVPRGKERAAARLDLLRVRNYYLRWMRQYSGAHWMALFLESAETPRMVSRLGASPLYRAVLAKLLGTMLLTLRGTPMIYQGEELGLANTRFSSAEELRDAASLRLFSELKKTLGEDAALQKVLCYAADHAQTPMPWSAGPCAGFTGAEPWMRLPDGVEHLNAALQLEDKNSVLAHYQKLIALRKKTPCLVYGSFNPVFLKNRRVFCYFRIHEGNKWYVEMNLTERQVPRPGRLLSSHRLQLSNYSGQSNALRPYEANLYRCD
ncbi:MAG: alpha-glucosidase [Ruminococcaceae bacterium]|nr:alpha-glucosidase [Oscillospiraceae bacterium]